LFKNTDIIQKPPGICDYIIANPKAFLDNPEQAKLYGFDIDEIKNRINNIEDLAYYLPVIYLADYHTEYGYLGFQLNNKLKDKKMVDFRSELKALRQSPVYLGGVRNQGSSFTMIHNKVGFPENRAFKTIPKNTEYRFFFSPEIAMANELCLTNDAKPNEFK
jgi:hypothetical protein